MAERARGKLKTRIVRRKLAELKPAEINARYMDHEMFLSLVANLKRDQVLTSAPLIAGDDIISGHHRIEAAIQAGIKMADCIEILTKLSAEEQRAIQLGHNSLAGSDDAETLEMMLAGLTAEEFAYAQVRPEELDLADDAVVEAGTVHRDGYIYVGLAFLPEDHAIFRRAMRELSQRFGELAEVHAAPYATFPAFFRSASAVRRRYTLEDATAAVLHMVEAAAAETGDEGEAKTEPSAGADAGA